MWVQIGNRIIDFDKVFSITQRTEDEMVSQPRPGKPLKERVTRVKVTSLGGAVEHFERGEAEAILLWTANLKVAVLALPGDQSSAPAGNMG